LVEVVTIDLIERRVTRTAKVATIAGPLTVKCPLLGIQGTDRQATDGHQEVANQEVPSRRNSIFDFLSLHLEVIIDTKSTCGGRGLLVGINGF
jgi:hypothetical protein